MVKEYYAFVRRDYIEEFEAKLNNYDKVKSFKRCGLWVNAQRTYFYPYVIEAEEGIIDPKWELTKNTKEWSWLKS